jgi:hypothetical protein
MLIHIFFLRRFLRLSITNNIVMSRLLMFEQFALRTVGRTALIAFKRIRYRLSHVRILPMNLAGQDTLSVVSANGNRAKIA